MADAPDLLQQVNDLGKIQWSGTAYRHTAPNRDPHSGVGALRFGGRWNPPDVVSTIYLASPVSTCIAEFQRSARGQARGESSFLERIVHEFNVDSVEVVDLTPASSLSAVGLSMAAIRSPDWEPCQRIGEMAHYLGLQGVLAPSATGAGVVLALFETRLKLAQLQLVSSSNMSEVK